MLRLRTWLPFAVAAVAAAEDAIPDKTAIKDPCGHLDTPVKRPHKAKADEVVLVTGGSGFIGSTLVEQLLDLGYHVRVLDNLGTGNILFLDLANPRLELLFGDILDEAVIKKSLEGNVVGVMHLAAASKVLPSLVDPKMATFNTVNNAVGSANVLQEIALAKKVKKVVYAASSTYYGNAAPPYDEDTLFNTTSPYAAAKYMGELQMQTFDKIHNVPSVNLRFFMVYGPRNPSSGGYAIVTGVFVRQKQDGKKLTIQGTGEQFRDFVHVSDVARACVLAMQHPTLRETTVNVGSGIAYSVNDIGELVSPGEERERLPARKNDLLGTMANTCKARRELDFVTEKQFTKEMAELVKQALQGEDFTYKTTQGMFRQYFGAGEWDTWSLEMKNEKVREAVTADGKFIAERIRGFKKEEL